ncbi:hypothetical protein [Haladaptatus salinisoli]|uniref:hypothetical protein n=1 Tax=Haladaptatus salinisoli TaxID=2884876 RepID=UPI001D0A1E47|nr:hypothetical protein [Haladaptatus salinisoli]
MIAPESAAREHVLDAHEETVASVLRCADQVAGTWRADAATDREAVVEPFSRRLRDAGAMARLPDVLSGAVSAAGFSMRATPVPAPPYVVVTGRGPMLRATVSTGRLVVLLRAFDVIREGETRYVRGPDDPRDAVSVDFSETK